jgi:hypothetical protein
LKALADNGYLDGKNVEIVYKNAQAALGINREVAAREAFEIPKNILKRADRIISNERK